MPEDTRKQYATIQVLPATKDKFIKRFQKAKADKPYYYIDQFVNDLLAETESK